MKFRAALEPVVRLYGRTAAADVGPLQACDAAFPRPEPLARRSGETWAAHLARQTDVPRAELSRWRSARRWHPHQLRHTAATEARRAHGVGDAQDLLGHRSVAAARLYAGRSDELAGRRPGVGPAGDAAARPSPGPARRPAHGRGPARPRPGRPPPATSPAGQRRPTCGSSACSPA